MIFLLYYSKGVNNMDFNTSGLEYLNILNPVKIHRNLSVPQLVEKSLAAGEGVLGSTGALCVKTGKYTGRSPKDRFIVDEPNVHDHVAWGTVNKPISEDVFDSLLGKIQSYLQKRELYVFDGFVGADPEYRLAVRFVNEFAWQNLFVHQLFLRPTEEELKDICPDFTVICAPGFNAIPEIDHTNSEAFVLVNISKRLIVIGGTSYAGEMKKSIFSVMNYLLPFKDVFPMHCSANVGSDGSTALFFGLSGTGKTTLSADPERSLIGDDEHGWSDHGIFNFEGGCYAKCINLTLEKEPQIWNAIKFGSVIENVKIDPETRLADYSSSEYTENTRTAYPVDYIPNSVIPAMGGHPKAVVFLTADAFGVLPPISKLEKKQAMYHFMSGYTSKLAGTERGIVEPEATFSTCFGEPFMLLSPLVYAEMLGKRLDEHDSEVFLINTGWSGGPYGVGKRINLEYTRKMVSAAVDGKLADVKFNLHPVFNVLVPESCPGVPSEILDPRNTWKDKEAYDVAAHDLAARFVENFSHFKGATDEIAAAGPRP